MSCSTMRELATNTTCKVTYDGALEAYTEARQIVLDLLQTNPKNTIWRNDLTFIRQLIAGPLRDKKDIIEARSVLQEALTDAQQLANLDPGNEAWQLSLADTYYAMAWVDVVNEKYRAARKAQTDERDVIDRLTKIDPANTGYQQRLADSYELRARLLRDKTGEQAAEAGKQGIASTLAGAAQSDASRKAPDEFPTAKAALDAAADIRERLANSDPQESPMAARVGEDKVRDHPAKPG